MPETIAALEAEADRLQGVLADPALYGKDPEGFSKSASDLEATQEKIAAAEHQWLELELLKQDLEGS